MGDGIKAMYEDYDDYENLCRRFNETQKPMYGDPGVRWLDHFRELKERQAQEEG